MIAVQAPSPFGSLLLSEMLGEISARLDPSSAVMFALACKWTRAATWRHVIARLAAIGGAIYLPIDVFLIECMRTATVDVFRYALGLVEDVEASHEERRRRRADEVARAAGKKKANRNEIALTVLDDTRGFLGYNRARVWLYDDFLGRHVMPATGAYWCQRAAYTTSCTRVEWTFLGLVRYNRTDIIGACNMVEYDTMRNVHAYPVVRTLHVGRLSRPFAARQLQLAEFVGLYGDETTARFFGPFLCRVPRFNEFSEAILRGDNATLFNYYALRVSKLARDLPPLADLDASVRELCSSTTYDGLTASLLRYGSSRILRRLVENGQPMCIRPNIYTISPHDWTYCRPANFKWLDPAGPVYDAFSVPMRVFYLCNKFSNRWPPFPTSYATLVLEQLTRAYVRNGRGDMAFWEERQIAHSFMDGALLAFIVALARRPPEDTAVDDGLSWTALLGASALCWAAPHTLKHLLVARACRDRRAAKAVVVPAPVPLARLILVLQQTAQPMIARTVLKCVVGCKLAFDAPLLAWPALVVHDKTNHAQLQELYTATLNACKQELGPALTVDEMAAPQVATTYQ